MIPEPAPGHASWLPLRSCRFSHLLLICVFAGLCFGSVVCPVAASAGKKKSEKPYALIFGTVWGPDNRPLYGVRVRIRRADQKKPKWELYSDHNGEFAQRLPSGKAEYLVRADLKGYKSPNGKQLQAGPEVSVQIENDERADMGLHLKY